MRDLSSITWMASSSSGGPPPEKSAVCELAAHGEASLVPENDFGGWVAGCVWTRSPPSREASLGNHIKVRSSLVNAASDNVFHPIPVREMLSTFWRVSERASEPTWRWSREVAHRPWRGRDCACSGLVPSSTCPREETFPVPSQAPPLTSG